MNSPTYVAGARLSGAQSRACTVPRGASVPSVARENCRIGEGTELTQSGKRKHIPQRTCIACRSKRPKRELVRIVRAPDGDVAVDKTGKQSGRGAYLCPTRECWHRALSEGLLSRALRVSLTEETRTCLDEYVAGF